MIWNVRAAFTEARDKYFLPRATNPALSGVEQAQCGEAANACDRAINALQVDDTWPQGQRQARFTDCRDKVTSLTTVDRSHQFAPAFLYDGLDLLNDAAFCGNDGLVTFVSSVLPLP